MKLMGLFFETFGTPGYEINQQLGLISLCNLISGQFFSMFSTRISVIRRVMEKVKWGKICAFISSTECSFY